MKRDTAPKFQGDTCTHWLLKRCSILFQIFTSKVEFFSIEYALGSGLFSVVMKLVAKRFLCKPLAVEITEVVIILLLHICNSSSHESYLRSRVIGSIAIGSKSRNIISIIWTSIGRSHFVDRFVHENFKSLELKGFYQKTLSLEIEVTTLN